MAICTRLHLVCRDVIDYPLYVEVRRGDRVGSCEVIYAAPNPCVIAPSTDVVISRSRKVFEVRELSNNVAIIEKRDGSSDIYVYPKDVWREVLSLYIKPLAEGDRPMNIGLLLIGAPGVGKTTLARKMAEILGINCEIIRTDDILTPYVGESERKLKERLSKALSREPTIIVVDDAEWLVGARSLTGGPGTGYSDVRMCLQNILFDEMQKCYNEGRKVLFVATTNVSINAIDVAFQREGRFGRPVIIPLPDYEAVLTVLRFYLKGKNIDVEDLARRCVNAGLSMADVMGIVYRILRGLSYTIKPSHGRGYQRVYVDRVSGFEKIFDSLLPRDIFDGPSRIWIPENTEVATAIAIQLAMHAGKTCLKIVDPRYLDEATYMANLLKSVVIVPSTMPPEWLRYIHDNAEVPIIFVGKQPPHPIEVFHFPPIQYLYRIVPPKALIEAVAKYRGINIDSERYAQRYGYDPSKLTRLLEALTTLNTVNDKIIDIVVYR